MDDLSKLRIACLAMLSVEEEQCIAYGTGSVHGGRVAMLLAALGMGTLDEWVKRVLAPRRAANDENRHRREQEMQAQWEHDRSTHPY